jgi:hypothetical protein
MWVQGNAARSSLTVGGLAGGAPVGTVGASGPDVAPLVAAVAALARVEVQGYVGGDMGAFAGDASMQAVAEGLLKLFKVLLIFLFFFKALIGVEWKRNDAPWRRAALQDARIEGGSGDLSLEGIGKSRVGEIGSGIAMSAKVLDNVSIMGEEAS